MLNHNALVFIKAVNTDGNAWVSKSEFENAKNEEKKRKVNSNLTQVQYDDLLKKQNEYLSKNDSKKSLEYRYKSELSLYWVYREVYDSLSSNQKAEWKKEVAQLFAEAKKEDLSNTVRTAGFTCNGPAKPPYDLECFAR